MKIPLTFQFDHTKIIGHVEIEDEYLDDPEIGNMIIAPGMYGKQGETMKVGAYGLIHIKNALLEKGEKDEA